MFEYKVRCRHKLGWKEIKLYADTDIEEFFNRNSIDYVRNMTDTVEHRQLKEIERLKKELEIEKDISDGMLETIDKTIKYIERLIPDDEYMGYLQFTNGDRDNILEILKKENK